MSPGEPAMHVARNGRSYMARSAERRVYESVLLRRSDRDGGKVKHETLANLKPLLEHVVAALGASLKGQAQLPTGGVHDHRSLLHRHVAAVPAMARKLGLPWL